MIERGFPNDLPVRPAHSLQLDWWITQRNLINIWLPEGVFSDAGSIEWFLLRDVTDLRWSSAKDGAWESRFAMKDRCEVVTRTTERKDGVDFTIRLTNRSVKTWPNANMPVCVQLATAPDFRDPGLQRTYHHAKDGWRKFAPTDAKPVYPGGCHFFGGMRLRACLESAIGVPTLVGCLSKRPPIPPKGGTPNGCKRLSKHTLSKGNDSGRAEIRASSKCGQWHLSHSFDNAVSVGGNCHESICCVHANPVVGELKPGETKESRGWLHVRKESVNARPLG
ncbi:MAG: hypothetical protein EXS18_00090 [Verrucomicrobiae bacterium]|nr:hypothetical protein [Verrucomicrobiae bacterium]